MDDAKCNATTRLVLFAALLLLTACRSSQPNWTDRDKAEMVERWNRSASASEHEQRIYLQAEGYAPSDNPCASHDETDCPFNE